MMRSAAELLEELRALDESATIEAKTAAQVDRSILATVCAFANEPGLGGGYLLLGVAPSPQIDLFGRSYEVVGVSDPDKLQSDLATQCASTFSRPIRPQLSVEKLEGKVVLVAFVPELAPTDKPVYLKSLGLPRGAYRRIGPTDQEGTEDDLVVLYQGRQSDSFDSTVLSDASFADLDPELLRVYRQSRRAVNAEAEELHWSDEDLLDGLGAATRMDGVQVPTVAGLLLFGTTKALRRRFPMMRIDYIRIPGREWVKDPEHRFDTVEIRAPLLLAIPRAIAAVRDDLPASFRLPEGALVRRDETVLPVRVLREAIVNAVMHRSYRINGAIQILRYANRIEIRNPGHSLKAEDKLGEPGSQTRNPRIAGVLHDLHFAETKGSGIRAMRQLMLDHDLLPPAFESSRSPDQFVATFLFHHLLDPSDLTWLRQTTQEKLSDEEARALVFTREVGAIDNAAYRDINRVDTLNASGHLRRLRDLGILTMKGSGNRTYYVLASPVSTVPSLTPPELPADPHKLPADPHKLPADPHKLPSDPHKHAPATPGDPPASLLARIAAAGVRPRQEALRTLIIELCGWRPHSARELAELLGKRDPRELVRQHLRPLVEAGALAYEFPEMPNHPQQKYRLPGVAPE